MTIKEFEKEHKALTKKYNVGRSWNCDLESIATGIMYYGKEEGDKDDEWSKYLFTITGIGYNRYGDLDGDFEGVIDNLREGLLEHYKF